MSFLPGRYVFSKHRIEIAQVNVYIFWNIRLFVLTNVSGTS